MRLTKIKLAGFKSFVDPTTVYLPSNLIGVVGPNGCGKSNIIDAVRWVMGESSAKNLRGESMDDVIFSGSSSRKPVGQASIELVFDNSDGTISGQYAAFSEISIRRLVSRDGQSNYYLNGSKCRKKDITDVFLGTGLGPRSYSIIEQGMISRLIEAKPVDMRVYLEEAAGISKYKERRRETENRIKHARENLARVNDLREEVDKQLNRLQRQAKTAEKYKEHKETERRLKAEFLVLRLRDLQHEIATEQTRVNEKENRLQEAIAQQRSIEAALERDRQSQHEASDIYNDVQRKYYGIGGEIAKKEQAITHARQLAQRQKDDLSQVENTLKGLQVHLEQDQTKIHTLQSQLETDAPAFALAKECAQTSQEMLNSAEQNMHDWQQRWEEFSRVQSAPSELVKVESIRMEQLLRQNEQHSQRVQRLEAEIETLQVANNERKSQELRERLTQTLREQEDSEQTLADASDALLLRQANVKQLTEDLEQVRESYQDSRGALIKLEAQVQAQQGQTHEQSALWIEQCGLTQATRLLDKLEVDQGWEYALETVLGKHRDAICVDVIDQVTGLLSSLQQGAVSLFETNAEQVPSNVPNTVKADWLSSKVRAPWKVDELLAGVYAATDLSHALALRATLAAHESVITREGIWLGRHWLRVVRASADQKSLLESKRDIEQLKIEVQTLTEQGQALKIELENAREHLVDAQSERETAQKDYNQAQQQCTRLQAEASTQDAKVTQIVTRQTGIQGELQEHKASVKENSEEIAIAKLKVEQAQLDIERLATERLSLQAEREQKRSQTEQFRVQALQESEAAHQLELAVGANKRELEATQVNLSRMAVQADDLRARQEALRDQIDQSLLPLETLETEQKDLLIRRLEVENELSGARRRVDDLDNALRQFELNRSTTEQRIQEVRSDLENLKMAWQEVRVRRQTVQEQFTETGYGHDELASYLDAEAQSAIWQQKLQELDQRIQKLGAINLAAIEEFKEQEERKQYLDAQYTDVSEALATLEEAIRKIDRETKQKFAETFDKVNEGLTKLFPRLFGGGSAYLELTEDDLLNAGVTVMARPPGKRNSTIHLLSGGEKALTAVALVFSIFMLNPSPFCMLDEVDAPLDDANVGRFCDMVKAMSDKVQFIFITHNKITMSIAHQLSGVTMQEAGVSRLVAVDVDEAIKLVAV